MGFGWLGFLIAAGIFITGTSWFIGLDFIPELTLWVALLPLEWLWTIALGILMWQKSNTASVAQQTKDNNSR